MSMAAENAAEVAALRGWKVYFNTVTIAGRRNLAIATWTCILGTLWLNKKRRQRKALRQAQA
ncbi:hypothetical protein GBAR_LOCUS31674 [Geodia barretti]|uniref:Uncharacterized protein n=1 Tax=Geodia barretti TaxID=519541 RepID=A0AA35U3R3_GEOBA|nr:hypothetical protein GBAR_LOCUS31674 [Geodia barretti]